MFTTSDKALEFAQAEYGRQIEIGGIRIPHTNKFTPKEVPEQPREEVKENYELKLEKTIHAHARSWQACKRQAYKEKKDLTYALQLHLSSCPCLNCQKSRS